MKIKNIAPRIVFMSLLIPSVACANTLFGPKEQVRSQPSRMHERIKIYAKLFFGHEITKQEQAKIQDKKVIDGAVVLAIGVGVTAALGYISYKHLFNKSNPLPPQKPGNDPKGQSDIPGQPTSPPLGTPPHKTPEPPTAPNHVPVKKPKSPPTVSPPAPIHIPLVAKKDWKGLLVEKLNGLGMGSVAENSTLENGTLTAHIPPETKILFFGEHDASYENFNNYSNFILPKFNPILGAEGGDQIQHLNIVFETEGKTLKCNVIEGSFAVTVI